MEIYLRSLNEQDAKISYQWRNNPKVWRNTRFKPLEAISLQLEQEWIKLALTNKDEKRFAICIKETNEYIGNGQLTDIIEGRAQYHIFIGEVKYWGMGIGKRVAWLVLDYAFNTLGLKEVYAYFKPENIASIKACEKNGFIFKEVVNGELLFICQKESFNMN